MKEKKLSVLFSSGRWHPWTRRLWCAGCIIFCLFALLFLFSCLSRSQPNLILEAFALGEDDSSSVQAGGIWDSHGSVATLASSTTVEILPELFCTEVSALPEAQDVWINEDETIVGCTFPYCAEEAFSSLRSELENKGWSYVESGSMQMASFVKQGGTYSWLFVSCSDISGKASTVIQVA